MLTEEQAKSNLAANLAAVLREMGWTQSDLARAIQEDDEDIQAARMRAHRYVRALCIPAATTLANMADRLGVTVDWLLSTPRKKRTSHAR